ncbi:ferredoxin:CoB-CoM heterodisulfide reductase subunit HdrC [Methanobrevibacter sp. DSM 116169]|uniref:ferredoxin:CoB-CoM heterodisulfide reductase subunit HdrC n=1 Tax=Methanobrevibacter sp. DSM 116169 TaxID=3242727 RepID=UPI0038FD2285
MKLKLNEEPHSLANYILNDLKSSENMGLLRCVQCGMCTSTCPGARHSQYNPRDMIERILQGDTTVIKDEDIWNCFYCYTCHSICPVGNSACEVNQILRQIAIDSGEVNEKVKPFLEFGDSFLTLAIGGIPSIFFPQMREDIGDEWWEFKENLDNVREELDLDSYIPTEDSIEEVRTLLINSGFEKRIKKIDGEL